MTDEEIGFADCSHNRRLLFTSKVDGRPIEIIKLWCYNQGQTGESHRKWRAAIRMTHRPIRPTWRSLLTTYESSKKQMHRKMRVWNRFDLKKTVYGRHQKLVKSGGQRRCGGRCPSFRSALRWASFDWGTCPVSLPLTRDYRQLGLSLPCLAPDTDWCTHPVSIRKRGQTWRSPYRWLAAPSRRGCFDFSESRPPESSPSVWAHRRQQRFWLGYSYAPTLPVPAENM